jgi:S1-C subfamily serine protease
MSKVKKTVGVWLIAALLALAIPSAVWLTPMSVPAVQTENLSERLVKTTWLVDNGHGSGTGVAVRLPDGSLGVLTAAHVVGDAKLVVLTREARGNRGPKSVLMVKADVVKVWAEWDVALLKPWAPELIEKVAEFDRAEPRLGDRLIHVGCQFGTSFSFTVLRGYVTNLRVTPKLPGWPWTHPLDQTDIAFRPGSSGGPVFRGGALAGLCVGAADSGLGVYVPVRDILPLLK